MKTNGCLSSPRRLFTGLAAVLLAASVAGCASWFGPTVEVEGEEGWTVAEYETANGTFTYASYSDGKYTLTMDSLNYLVVEGTADLENGVNPYSLLIVGTENGATDVIVLDDLTGSKGVMSP